MKREKIFNKPEPKPFLKIAKFFPNKLPAFQCTFFHHNIMSMVTTAKEPLTMTKLYFKKKTRLQKRLVLTFLHADFHLRLD
jgi:hypothetical protein